MGGLIDLDQVYGGLSLKVVPEPLLVAPGCPWNYFLQKGRENVRSMAYLGGTAE